MSEEANDDIFTSKWFRALVAGAVLSGGLGGVTSLSVDDADRYRGADAKRDFDARDAKINANDARLKNLEAQIFNHLQHSATYTQVIVENQKDLERLERRLRELEQMERSEHGSRK